MMKGFSLDEQVKQHFEMMHDSSFCEKEKANEHVRMTSSLIEINNQQEGKEKKRIMEQHNLEPIGNFQTNLCDLLVSFMNWVLNTAKGIQ